MPALPGRRWQPPICRSEKTVWLARPGDRRKWVKGRCWLPDVRKLLAPETAFICHGVSQGHPKRPCGGSTKSAATWTKPAVYVYKIYDRAFRMGREEMLLEVLPPWIGIRLA